MIDMDKEIEKIELHQWQVGDLGEYEHEGETIRALRLTAGASTWINERGLAGIINTSRYPVRFLTQTGLLYQYVGNPTAEEEFKKGLFSSYFETPL